MHPDDAERVSNDIREALKSGEKFNSEYRMLQADGSVRWLLARGYCIRDAEGRAIRLPGATIDITDRKDAEVHRELLTAELNHRVKNTLAIVQSIASQSLRDGMSMLNARAAFLTRLKAISNAHDLLTLESWVGADLGSVVRAVVDVYVKDSERFRLQGPALRLSPSSALAITMALNELATNAIKYGSLSQPGGYVDVTWSVTGDDLKLAWVEAGGPPVKKPSKKGFGSRLIQNGLATELNGKVDIDYRPTGLVCIIAAPLRSIGQIGPSV